MLPIRRVPCYQGGVLLPRPLKVSVSLSFSRDGWPVWQIGISRRNLIGELIATMAIVDAQCVEDGHADLDEMVATLERRFMENEHRPIRRTSDRVAIFGPWDDAAWERWKRANAEPIVWYWQAPEMA